MRSIVVRAPMYFVKTYGLETHLERWQSDPSFQPSFNGGLMAIRRRKRQRAEQSTSQCQLIELGVPNAEAVNGISLSTILCFILGPKE